MTVVQEGDHLAFDSAAKIALGDDSAICKFATELLLIAQLSA